VPTYGTCGEIHFPGVFSATSTMQSLYNKMAGKDNSMKGVAYLKVGRLKIAYTECFLADMEK
jgi:hypothetical protein